MAFSVYVTRPIPEAGIRILQRACGAVDVGPADRSQSAEELIAAIRNRDGVLCNVSDAIGAEVLEAVAGRCKVFANFGVGVNHIDLAAAERLGIVVTNTPGVLTDATADLTWALMLTTARRLSEGITLVSSGQWSGWTPTQLLGHDVTGRTLGIVGAGRIGTAVGLRSAGFQMPILYVERSEREELDSIGGRRVELGDCLAGSDFVTLHVPLTAETRHLIGERELGLMRSGAILINTSRGEVVDERALVRALQEKQIAAAGLDVFENEPHPLPELLELPTVVCLPHLGSATVATRDRMAEISATDLLRVLNGDPPLHPVAG